MTPHDKPPDDQAADSLVDEFRRAKAREAQTYRARALKLFPHVCGHCGREFEGRRLRELTVHHKDLDPTNNPSDGSNWELLCLYCHDNEHARNSVADAVSGEGPHRKRRTGGLNHPFADLDKLLENHDDRDEDP